MTIQVTRAWSSFTCPRDSVNLFLDDCTVQPKYIGSIGVNKSLLSYSLFNSARKENHSIILH